MRKKLIILLILLFIFSVVGFISLGGQIRDALSPKVTVIEISDELYGNKYYTKIPIGAVKTDGKNIFVYSVAQTDIYSDRLSWELSLCNNRFRQTDFRRREGCGGVRFVFINLQYPNLLSRMRNKNVSATADFLFLPANLHEIIQILPN